MSDPDRDDTDGTSSDSDTGSTSGDEADDDARLAHLTNVLELNLAVAVRTRVRRAWVGHAVEDAAQCSLAAASLESPRAGTVTNSARPLPPPSPLPLPPPLTPPPPPPLPLSACGTGGTRGRGIKSARRRAFSSLSACMNSLVSPGRTELSPRARSSVTARPPTYRGTRAGIELGGGKEGKKGGRK